jgi:signal transduction histidine kinase
MFNELKAQTRQLNRELSEGRRMIDTILSFAALMNQETPLNRQPTNFEVLVHEAVSPLISLAVIHQIKLSFDIAAQLPLVSVDKDQMSEAIYHLAHNAIKFNRSGGSVLIYCYMIDTDLYVEVTDSGIGIAADKLAIIWDTFIQTADEGRRGVEGLGLGLAIVKLTIEAHGGEVIAKSTLGAGSTFGFRLPLAV